MRIYEPEQLAKLMTEIRESYNRTSFYNNFVLTSGHFDPLHFGHLQYLQSAQSFGNFWIVAVNSNAATIKKKGYYFLDEKERARIISNLRCVHYTVVWPEPTVDKLIELIKPNVFLNGGDYTKESQVNSLEKSACRAVGCKIIVGAGGTTKTNSSSEIIESFLERYKKKKKSV